ncbi:unnamed protein product [Onchocerca ochengi]|uniref:Iwr1 domain-containing protein n=1 Tax=Onchocerca ochengi TaxID=42157 RepID=A0A182E085_ONCOC|nr:unnamed protein product [Onchocerca ochengi]
MLTSHLTLPQSASSPSSCSTIFRVRRKRTADPLGALVISLKRAKQMPAVTEPIICFRTSTTDLKHFNIIDVDPHQNIINAVSPPSSNIDEIAEDSDSKSEISTTSPMELMKDFVEEPSSSSKIISETSIRSSQITLNGEPLVVLSNQDDEVRLANADDLLCDGEDTESSAGEDDDEDSNDENNWRNDYPDESEAGFKSKLYVTNIKGMFVVQTMFLLMLNIWWFYFEHTSGCGSDEDTASDGFDDYEDLEKHIGKMGFYDEDSEGDEDN